MVNLSSVPLARPFAGVPFDYIRRDSERTRVLRIANEVRRIVARYADVDPEDVVATLELDAVRAAPAAFDDVMLALEARFDLDIDDGEAAKWTTVADIVAWVAGQLRERRAA